MMVIVFRSRLKEDVLEEFSVHAEKLEELAQNMPGFVSRKLFEADDGERVSVIEFCSAADLEAWRNHPVHRVAQELGRTRYYEQYSLQICELVRESRFTSEGESALSTGAPELPARVPLAGGCFCGNIRYRIDAAPRSPTFCHCTMCRRASGAPVVAWATFPSDALVWERGSPRVLPSSDKAERGFCGDCGTALTFRFHAQPATTDVTIASLDEPSRVAPLDHIFVDSALGWLRLADGLPRFPEERGEGRD